MDELKTLFTLEQAIMNRKKFQKEISTMNHAKAKRGKIQKKSVRERRMHKKNSNKEGEKREQEQENDEERIQNFLQKMTDTKPYIQDSMNNKQDISQNNKPTKTNEKVKAVKNPGVKKKASLSKRCNIHSVS